MPRISKRKLATRISLNKANERRRFLQKTRKTKMLVSMDVPTKDVAPNRRSSTIIGHSSRTSKSYVSKSEILKI